MTSVPVGEEPADLDDLDFVYELKKPVGLRPVFSLLGGIALLAVAAVAFLLGLLLPPESHSFPLFIASTVLPTLGALAAFASGFSLMRSPRRVTVGSSGLSVEGERDARRWAWNEIGWASIGTGALGVQRQLSVYDVQGKKLVTLGSAFDDFDGLAESIKAAIDRKSDATADRIQSRKARRTGVLMMLGALAFLALGVANGWNARTEMQHAERLAAHGETIDATVKRHYLYNVTPRLEYEFTVPGGKMFTRDAMLTRTEWAALDGAATVPVCYDPADPDNNRLVAGEVENEHGSPGMNLLLSFGVGVLALFFFAVGLLQFSGWDIDLDSKTGKLSIKRFGTGR